MLLFMYFIFILVSRTSSYFFFSLKKIQRGGKKFPFHLWTFDHYRFLQDFERNLNISSGFRDIGSLVIHEPTLLPHFSAFVPCSCVSRNKGKKRERKRGGGKMEERRRKIALHATFWQIYITYLWKIHVSRANLRREFYSIYFFLSSSLKKSNEIREFNSGNCRNKEKRAIFLE